MAYSNTEEPVEILFFFSLNCRACERVRQNIFPKIEAKYKERIKIEKLDYGKPENFLRFLELQEEYDWHPEKIKTPTLFIDGKFLVGQGDIDKYLDIYIDTALIKKGYVSAPSVSSPPKILSLLPAKDQEGTVTETKPSIDLVSRFKLIRPLGVITAGLIDGINPCAFTVIIFFISFLALQGYDKRQVFAIGFSFILAVFIIYVLIGLGLFSFLFQLKAYWTVVNIVYKGGAILCFVLTSFAFYDFVKFRRTRQTQNLVLQLPPKLKEKIHRIIGKYYRREKDKGSEGKRDNFFGLIFSAFIVGCLVSIFEAVCTGQVYLPTIVFVLKTTPLKLKAFFYLLIYNLMFIIPLWLILLFFLWGVTSQQFSNFAQKHMGTIKILMVALFLGLGIFLILR